MPVEPHTSILLSESDMARLRAIADCYLVLTRDEAGDAEFPEIDERRRLAMRLTRGIA